MPIIYRQALTLRVKGYSIKEISEMTKTSEATVKSRIHRAWKLLLESFDEQPLEVRILMLCHIVNGLGKIPILPC